MKRVFPRGVGQRWVPCLTLGTQDPPLLGKGGFRRKDLSAAKGGSGRKDLSAAKTDFNSKQVLPTLANLAPSI